mmetsp:Transcript_6509/g.13162  ORF Transcript_6509/g.13162 Transcript_6509/m.13162 type:complete len:724 (-) Transcript_6509:88-2259(-)
MGTDTRSGRVTRAMAMVRRSSRSSSKGRVKRSPPIKLSRRRVRSSHAKKFRLRAIHDSDDDDAGHEENEDVEIENPADSEVELGRSLRNKNRRAVVNTKDIFSRKKKNETLVHKTSNRSKSRDSRDPESATEASEESRRGCTKPMSEQPLRRSQRSSARRDGERKRQRQGSDEVLPQQTTNLAPGDITDGISDHDNMSAGHDELHESPSSPFLRSRKKRSLRRLQVSSESSDEETAKITTPTQAAKSPSIETEDVAATSSSESKSSENLSEVRQESPPRVAPAIVSTPRVHIPKPATPVHSLNVRKGGKSLEAARGKSNRRGSKDARLESSPVTSDSESDDDTPQRLFDKVQLGEFELDVWYFSPYPAEVCEGTHKLSICDQCFKYFHSPRALKRHRTKCPLVQPPGSLVYKDPEGRSIYVVEGRRNREYCRNLCLFCKLFLDQKTLFYDVDMFYFFVMVVNGKVVGYFSREARANKGLNLSCILTFPQYQSCGYGKFLISVSYAISVIEGRVGSPEKPLSDYGLVAYRSYWRAALLEYILMRMQAIPASALSQASTTRKPRKARPTSFVGLDDSLMLATDDNVEDEDCTATGNRSGSGKGKGKSKASSSSRDAINTSSDCNRDRNEDSSNPDSPFEDALDIIALGAPLWLDMKTLAKETGICSADIRDTFQHNNMFLRHDSQIILYIRRELLAKHLRTQPSQFFCNPTLLRRELLPKIDSRR